MAQNIYRRPERTQKKIDEIKCETNPKLALEGIVELFEDYVNHEEKVPTKYDEQTGKPVQFERKLSTYQGSTYSGRFKPEIYLGGVNLTDPAPEEPGLSKIILEFVKERNPVLVNTKFGKYVFIYEERDASGPEQGGGTYEATEHLISVRKVYELETKNTEVGQD